MGIYNPRALIRTSTLYLEKIAKLYDKDILANEKDMALAVDDSEFVKNLYEIILNLPKDTAPKSWLEKWFWKSEQKRSHLQDSRTLEEHLQRQLNTMHSLLENISYQGRIICAQNEFIKLIKPLNEIYSEIHGKSMQEQGAVLSEILYLNLKNRHSIIEIHENNFGTFKETGDFVALLNDLIKKSVENCDPESEVYDERFDELKVTEKFYKVLDNIIARAYLVKYLPAMSIGEKKPIFYESKIHDIRKKVCSKLKDALLLDSDGCLLCDPMTALRKGHHHTAELIVAESS